MFSTFDIKVIALALIGVGIQGFFSWKDGWLYQDQLPFGKTGFTFWQHGGMWSDVTLIPYIVAYIGDHYELPCVSWLSAGCLAAAAIAWLVLLEQYRGAGFLRPEAHTHYGHTTVAGWIHYVFAVTVTWYILLVVFGVPDRQISLSDVLHLGITLTLFFPLGQWKFNNPAWQWQRDLNFMQIGVMTAITWLVLIGKHKLWFVPVETWVRANVL